VVAAHPQQTPILLPGQEPRLPLAHAWCDQDHGRGVRDEIVGVKKPKEALDCARLAVARTRRQAAPIERSKVAFHFVFCSVLSLSDLIRFNT
jgi:hypothetical protein